MAIRWNMCCRSAYERHNFIRDSIILESWVFFENGNSTYWYGFFSQVYPIRSKVWKTGLMPHMPIARGNCLRALEAENRLYVKNALAEQRCSQ